MTRPALFGVLYAEDFDAVAPAEPEPQPSPPGFTEADVAEARRLGHEAGLREAEHGLAASRVQLLRLVAEGLAAGTGDAARVAQDAAEATARCMLSCLLACLPTLCATHGPAELRALVHRILPALTEEPRIAIRVHPHMLPAMRDEVDRLDAELAGRVTLSATDTVPPGDARITWADGGAVRDAHAARGAVRDALAALGLLQEDHADA